MYDDRSKIEQHAGELVRMWFEFFASQHTVKYDSRIRKICRLQRARLHTPCVRRVSGTKTWLSDILCGIRVNWLSASTRLAYIVGTIGLSIFIFVTEVAYAQ